MTAQKEITRYKACLMGASFETGNRGVAALAAASIKSIIQVRPNADISLLIGNRIARIGEISVAGRVILVPVINYRLSPRARLHEHLLWILFAACLYRAVPLKALKQKLLRFTPWLRAMEDAHFIGDIHGGDSFSDIYGLKRFMIEVIPNIITIIMKKKLILLPQTFGPYKHWYARYIASLIIRRAERAMTRDKEGIEILEGIGAKKGRIVFCPDVAFTLDAAKAQQIKIIPPLECASEIEVIGINVNGLMYNGGYSRNNMFSLKCDYRAFLYKLVIRLLSETGSHVVFIPHTFGLAGNINSDPDASQHVMNMLSDKDKQRVHMLIGEYDQSEIKGIIGQCDYFIGSRMHACIAALSQGIPTTAVAYSRKFRGVFDSIGFGDSVIDGRFIDTDTAVEKVIENYRSRIAIKTNLQKKIVNIQSKIYDAFKVIAV